MKTSILKATLALIAVSTVLPAQALPPRCTVSNGTCLSIYTDIEGPNLHLYIWCNDGSTWEGEFPHDDIRAFCEPD